MPGLFGPTIAEAWSALAQQTGAEFQDGNFFLAPVVVYDHQQWQMRLDTFTVSTGKSSTTYTRLRAPYMAQDDLIFKLMRKGFFGKIGDLLGMQDIRTGDSSFDDEFTVKGNNEVIIRELLNEEVKYQLGRHTQIHLENKQKKRDFKQALPEAVRILYYQQTGIQKDVEQLVAMFDLLAVTLDRLVAIGSASPESPGISVRRS